MVKKVIFLHHKECKRLAKTKQKKESIYYLVPESVRASEVVFTVIYNTCNFVWDDSLEYYPQGIFKMFQVHKTAELSTLPQLNSIFVSKYVAILAFSS